MRIFVYEHLCAGGPAPPALRAEGRAMLTALLDDFVRLPDVEVATMLAPGMRAPARVAAHDPAGAEEPVFRRLAAAADWTLVVAPESGGALAERLGWAHECCPRVLGPTPEAARLAGDKLRLAERLRECGVPTPPAAAWPAEPAAYPAVCKARDGAGSQATYFVRDRRETEDAVRRARAEGYAGEMIVQPHVPGRAAAVAFLTGPGGRLALPAADQVLSDDGRFRYRGGVAPLPPHLAGRATLLAAAALETVMGLRGYVGVDVVIGPSGEGDAVIEINPRLTTSYVGLRALARCNLAAAMLAVASGERAPELQWRAGPVKFRADGLVSFPGRS